LERMVGDLLDATRIEAGKLELRPELRDLRTLAHDTVGWFEELSSRHELRVELPDEPAEVRIDPLRMEQVLHNLLSNAIKYSPMGGEVTLRLVPAEDVVKVEVVDHGIGITPEQLEAVFEPFRRPGALKNLVPGVGLGLSVCKRIVEAHGGTISVRSTAGEGTVFTVELPRPHVAPDGAAPVAPPVA
ncbi:MAG: sensor histidine kinase, partial [Myxococcales bacterium]